MPPMVQKCREKGLVYEPEKSRNNQIIGALACTQKPEKQSACTPQHLFCCDRLDTTRCLFEEHAACSLKPTKSHSVPFTLSASLFPLPHASTGVRSGKNVPAADMLRIEQKQGGGIVYFPPENLAEYLDSSLVTPVTGGVTPSPRRSQRSRRSSSSIGRSFRSFFDEVRCRVPLRTIKKNG